MTFGANFSKSRERSNTADKHDRSWHFARAHTIAAAKIGYVNSTLLFWGFVVGLLWGIRYLKLT
jgi:hypothetical protein